MEMVEVFREGFKTGPMLAPPASSSGETPAHCLKALAELEDRIKVIQHILEAISPAKIDIEEVKRLLDEQEAMYNQLQLRYLLYHAHIFVELEEISEAQEMVKLAMKTVNWVDNKIETARVWYWKGPIEFLRGNIPAARRYFLAAQPCAADDEQRVESIDVRFYRDITLPGINDQTRVARFRAYQDLIQAGLLTTCGWSILFE